MWAFDMLAIIGHLMRSNGFPGGSGSDHPAISPARLCAPTGTSNKAFSSSFSPIERSTLSF